MYENSIIYQIYPKSFRDTNGDGVGDINGIIEGLDYLQSLGVDAVWISPCYKSPDFDCGYDISDYRSISEQYGTMEDFDRLVDELHKRGMKILMDLVVNHTSYEHEWFLKAKRSRDDPYHDYYIWRRKDELTEDATGEFGGGVWQYCPECDEYYLHLFTPEQPDLNWDNPAVRQEIADMVNWWLDKGVDGFRCDVIYLISKDDKMEQFGEGPHLHEYLRELNDRAFEPHGAFTVAEVWGFTPEDTLRLIGYDRHELTMAFQFEHMCLGRTGRFDPAPFDPADFVAALARWQTGLEGKAPCALVLENHDQTRIVSRYGDPGRYRAESAKTLAMLTFLMKGTVFIYQGQELGLVNPIFTDTDGFMDVETVDYIKANKDKLSEKELLERVNFGTRDAGRVPFPRTADENSHFGFCPANVKPWLRAKLPYEATNAETEEKDPGSVLNFYKKLNHLNRTDDVLINGKFNLLANGGGLFAYERYTDTARALIVGSFGDNAVEYELPEEYSDGKILLSSYNDEAKISGRKIYLRPWQTFLVNGAAKQV